MSKVLLVEDDAALAESVMRALERENHMADSASSFGEALERLEAFSYDLLILDWELPGGSGIEILRRFRTKGGAAPVLMLTGRSSIDDKELGFDTGADDYMTKPFNARELASRVKALLRRPTTFSGNTIQVADLTMDILTRKVTRNTREIQLQPNEFTLLQFLMKHPDHVFSTEMLMRRCWASEAEVSLDAVYICVRRLRKKIQIDGEAVLLVTVHGAGYSLQSTAKKNGDLKDSNE